jgi:hypothetical protein
MADLNTPVTNTPLQTLQAAFCLIKLGGNVLLVDREEVALALRGLKLGDVAFYKRSDGEMLMRRYLEKLPAPCDVKKTIADFWVNPNTHMYTDIAFSPTPQPDTTLNYWVGSLINPAAGNWDTIKTHLLEVVCNDDTTVYEYLIKYLAHMLQRPEEKPGVMIILLGNEGVGKGIFFQILERIWPKTYLMVSDINKVLGTFNATLERYYVVIMDEALFSGDRKSQDRMKSLITEKTCVIEQKFQPARTIQSVHRFFASSNHDHFAHIAADDRRSMFVRVSAKHKDNLAYFAQLGNAIKDDQVIAAMIYELMNTSLAGYNVRARPITHEHSNQKLLSLQGFDRYWYEVLMTGDFNTREYGRDLWSEPRFVRTRSLLVDYQEFDKRSQRFARTLSKEIADALTRLCPSAKKDRQTDHGEQGRGHALPDLKTARKEFETVYRCTIDWGDLEEAEQALVEST